METKDFFDERDEMEKYIDEEFDEIADCFYFFAYGRYDKEKLVTPKLLLKDVVVNERSCQDGICRIAFQQIDTTAQQLREIERQYYENNEMNLPKELLTDKLESQYEDLIQDFSKRLFLYGVKFGFRVSKKI